MTHTPGPWAYFPDDEGCIVHDLSDEHVVCFGHDYDEYGSISSVANARLIALAPEMAALLREMIDHCLHVPMCGCDATQNDPSCRVGRARALLATLDKGDR